MRPGGCRMFADLITQPLERRSGLVRRDNFGRLVNAVGFVRGGRLRADKDIRYGWGGRLGQLRVRFARIHRVGRADDGSTVVLKSCVLPANMPFRAPDWDCVTPIWIIRLWPFSVASAAPRFVWTAVVGLRYMP